MNGPAGRTCRHRVIIGLAVVLTVLLAGCSSTPRYTGKSVPGDLRPPTVVTPSPPPSANRSYNYRVVTDDCNCENYTMRDEGNKVEYRFAANYTMNNGIATNVSIDLTNRSRDTLYLDQATAKVFSRNISYMYNNMFIPLPMLAIAPGSSNSITLNGKDRTAEDDWHKIAGEQLTITLKGLRIGMREIPLAEVTFIPENPLLGR